MRILEANYFWIGYWRRGDEVRGRQDYRLIPMPCQCDTIPSEESAVKGWTY